MQVSGHLTLHGTHHHVHLFFHHLHLLCHAQGINFQFGRTTGVLLLLPTSGVAFFLVVPFLVIIHWGKVIVAFTPALFFILIVVLDHSVAPTIAPTRGFIK